MFVTNWISTTKIQKISEITNFFRHYFLSRTEVDYWIYGHSHRNIDRIIGNTQCVSNQLGYVNHGESESFNSKKCINLML